jgi:hypothetical protein
MLQVAGFKVLHGRFIEVLPMEVKHEKGYFMFIIPQISIPNITLVSYQSTLFPFLIKCNLQSVHTQPTRLTTREVSLPLIWALWGFRYVEEALEAVCSESLEV